MILKNLIHKIEDNKTYIYIKFMYNNIFIFYYINNLLINYYDKNYRYYIYSVIYFTNFYKTYISFNIINNKMIDNNHLFYLNNLLFNNFFYKNYKFLRINKNKLNTINGFKNYICLIIDFFNIFYNFFKFKLIKFIFVYDSIITYQYNFIKKFYYYLIKIYILKFCNIITFKYYFDIINYINNFTFNFKLLKILLLFINYINYLINIKVKLIRKSYLNIKKFFLYNKLFVNYIYCNKIYKIWFFIKKIELLINFFCEKYYYLNIKNNNIDGIFVKSNIYINNILNKLFYKKLSFYNYIFINYEL